MASWRGGLFRDGLAQVELTIHPGHFHASYEGMTIVDWHGDPERLSLWHGASTREGLFIWTGQAKYVIESASLIPIKPEPPVSRPARLEREIDVLSLIDPDRDRIKGIWGINNGKLNSPEGHGEFYLPCVVPEEYTLSMTVEIPSDSREDPILAIGIPAGEFLGQIHIKNDDCLGIELIDGRRWNENETRLSGRYITPGVPARIDTTVTKQGIRMEIDGRTLIDWRGELRRLSPHFGWAPADARRMYFGSLLHLRVRDIKLTAPLPAPPEPAHDPITREKSVDLLSLIDPIRDARVGKWTKEGKVLRTLADAELTKLTVPVNVPTDYRLTLRVAREAGGPQDNEALNLILPVGNSKADVVIDGAGSQFTGMRIGHSDWNQNQTLYRGTVIPRDPPVEIVFDVTATGIKMTSQQKTMIDWTGNADNLTSNYDRRTADHRITISAFRTRFRIEKLEIQAIPSTSFPPVNPIDADGKVLPILDLPRDVREGEWKLEGDALTCPKTPACRLRIPATVPPRYVLSTNVERQEGAGHVYFGLPLAGRCTTVTIDGVNGTLAGIDRLNGIRHDNGANLTVRKYQSRLLPQSKSIPVRCFVLPDTIVVTCGGIELIRWHGDPRRLTDEYFLIPANYSDVDRSHAWLGSWDASFIFRDLELRPLTDAEANELESGFSGPFPTTPQLDVPLAPPAMKALSNTPTVPAKPNPVNSESRTSQPAKTGDWVDLLEWSEGVDWGSRGIKWNDNIIGKPARTGIRMKNAEAARFPLPAIIDGDYELEVEFTRFEGKGDAAIFFPMGNHTMRLLLSALGGEVSMIDFVDGKTGAERRPGTFANNQRHRVFIRVQTERDKSAFNIDFDDAKDFLKWEGATNSLTNVDTTSWRITMLRHVWIGSYLNDLEFHKVRVRMISGKAYPDVIIDADRERDLKNGFIRLVGEKASTVQVGFAQFTVNQLPLEFQSPAQAENYWPYITRDFKVCEDFYPAHAPSNIKCAIPKGAKSFSAVGYNDAGRASNYRILIDGKEVYESGSTDIAVAKVDIPPKSAVLELVTQEIGKNGAPTTYWCYPRFHSIAADKVKDKMLDGEAGPLKFSVASGTTGYGDVVHNAPIPWVQSVPINFRDAVPCDEFLFAHATSTVTYRIPEGMTRFTAIAYNVLSHSVTYEVWADAVRIYESPRLGIRPIDVRIPPGTKTIELRAEDMNGSAYDVSMWCYPRLYRK